MSGPRCCNATLKASHLCFEIKIFQDTKLETLLNPNLVNVEPHIFVSMYLGAPILFVQCDSIL